MPRIPWLLLGLVVLAQGVSAQQIYKCVGSDRVAYRDTPCSDADQQQRLTPAATEVNRHSDDKPSLDAVKASPSLPLSATQLFIGMTDTQVLNLASWARPAQIIRTKAQRAWREQWVYERRGERRLLYFENGRLLAQESAPAPTVQARAAIE